MTDVVLRSRSGEGHSRLPWTTRSGIAILWVLVAAAVFYVHDQDLRLYFVSVLSVMAAGGTLIALLAGWRGWRRGLAVEGITLFLAMIGLWLVGLVQLVIVASIIGAFVFAIVRRWRRRSDEAAP